METWMKFAFAIPMVLMAIYLFPRAKQMLKDSPKGSSDDWKAFLLPIIGVALFIFLLIKMV